MSRRPYRNHSPDFKSNVALEAVRGERPLAELAQKYDMHATQIAQLKAELLQGASTVFGATKSTESTIDVKVLHAKIGALTVKNDFLESALTKAGLLSAEH